MYQVAAFIHIVGAAIWLGGLLFVAAVLVPITRRMRTSSDIGTKILEAAGRGFRPVGWVSLSLLVLSGIWLLHERGVDLRKLLHGEGTFYTALRVKMVLVVILLGLTAIHDFMLGPRLARKMRSVPTNPLLQGTLSRERRLVSCLARLDLLLTLAIFALGVVLVRGNPF